MKRNFINKTLRVAAGLVLSASMLTAWIATAYAKHDPVYYCLKERECWGYSQQNGGNIYDGYCSSESDFWEPGMLCGCMEPGVGYGMSMTICAIISGA